MIVTALLAAATIQMVGPMRIAPGDVCPAYKATPAAALVEPARRGDAGAQTLKSLPPANQELTVDRRVSGCAVPTIVRENIQGDGRFSRQR